MASSQLSWLAALNTARPLAYRGSCKEPWSSWLRTRHPSIRRHQHARAPEAPQLPQVARLLRKGQTVRGDRGKDYLVDRVLHVKEKKFGRIYLARAGDREYLLKEMDSKYDLMLRDKHSYSGSLRRVTEECMSPWTLAAYNDQWLRWCPQIRHVEDVIPHHHMIVYEYMDDNLLQLAQRDIPLPIVKHILSTALKGIMHLHFWNFIHLDIKAGNVLLSTRKDARGLDTAEIKISNVERALFGDPIVTCSRRPLAFWIWQSPEILTGTNMCQASDMFSFGLVCVYAVTKTLMLQPDTAKGTSEIQDKTAVLEQLLSYFASDEDFDAFVERVEECYREGEEEAETSDALMMWEMFGLDPRRGLEEDWARTLRIMRGAFGTNFARKPFSTWDGPGLDADFKDLIAGLTNFDPKKRLTARQALRHKWFRSV